MSDRQLHLVRHAEVENPDGVLYGRLPGFGISELGRRMAESAAHELRGSDRAVGELIVSPLLRAGQSAEPIAQAFGLEPVIDERLIEPTNVFEGRPKSDFAKPVNWWRFWNPFRPSWGEPYRWIADRARAAMDDAWDRRAEGDIVMVSHQAVIWAAHRSVAGEPLFHNPAKRRCELSSITSFERRSGRWVELDYRTPASDLIADSVDVGAV